MKDIRLQHVTQEFKQYVVYLGNGTKNFFNSKRDARLFLGSTNNFLTDKMHELHNLYMDVHKKYHDVYFYLGPSSTQNNYQIDKKINDKLQGVLQSMDLAYSRCHFTNGNFFTFTHFFTIETELQEICRLLAPIYIGISNRSAVYDLDGLVKRLMYVHNELDMYGKRATTQLFRIPTHISETVDYAPELAELRVA